MLFRYLTSFGQSFYNQFDISFSADDNLTPDFPGRLQPFAAINLIYIFKEVMNNVVKHASAEEVNLTLTDRGSCLLFTLTDNGTWKEPDKMAVHHGLNNVQKR